MSKSKITEPNTRIISIVSKQIEIVVAVVVVVYDVVVVDTRKLPLEFGQN